MPRIGYHFEATDGEIDYSEIWKADVLKVTFNVSVNLMGTAILTVVSLLDS